MDQAQAAASRPTTPQLIVLTKFVFHKYVKSSRQNSSRSISRGLEVGVFSDHVRRYLDYGLVTIPCKDKRPVLGKEWERFCNETPTEDLVDKWEKQFKDINQLGLALGKSTFLSAFDFDYEYNEKKCNVSKEQFEKDRKNIERQILALLPPTPAIKTGRKGWTRLYRSHGNLENAQCERNGVRLFDFLARNKQTIIPPSKYSDDTDIVYRWQGPPIEECLDDVPFITQDTIAEIKFMLGEELDDNSRHGKLFKWIVRQSIITKDLNLLVKSAIAHDKEINNPTYLTDKKHFKTDDAVKNTTEWVKRIIKWRSAKPKGGGDSEAIAAIKSSREMYFQFFSQLLGKHKVDLMSDRLMVDVEIKTEYGTKTRRWRPADNMIKEIRSEARNIGLKHDPVEDHLSAYRKTLVPGLLLEIPKWDGVDRLGEICKITMPTNAPIEIYTDIMKDIAAGIFRRAFDSMEQNLFTIIRGPQGAGKNYFIDKVFCQPFGHYAAEVNVGTDQAKNYDAVEGRLVCVIGEFDQTQKVQVSFIKELITNASFTARRAYERTSERYDLRQTFFSASNFNNVLKDTSGNRRYVIWDMPKISWEYSKFCDSDQLRAQYFELYKENYRMGDKSRAWIKEFNAEETPDDPLELAVESYVEANKKMTGINYFADAQLSNGAAEIRSKDWLSSADVDEIIVEACRRHRISETRFRQELKRRGLSKRSNGTWFANLTRLSDKWGAVQKGHTEDKQKSF